MRKDPIGMPYRTGLRDGIPIALGYFAVSFALGIAAKQGGISPLVATIASLTNNASAGEYAAFRLIQEGASYLEMALIMLIVNGRYLLMSCSLSQKLQKGTPLWQRLLLAFGVTDENFGISMAYPASLTPFYTYGAMTVAIPGWALGTLLGVLVGNLLPARVLSALGVGLYGMFIAIIIPEGRRSRVIAVLIPICFLLSYLFSVIPFLSALSTGVSVIILTVAISLAAALLFPLPSEAMHKEETDG